MIRSLLVLSVLVQVVVAQPSMPEWTVKLEPYDIPGMPQVQSFASAHVGSDLLIIGGRRDGLHRFQPPTSFLAADNNTMIFVVDLERRTIDSVSVLQLDGPVADQLQSTNMQFVQDGTQLILMGGYGYATTVQRHITHPRISVIDVPGLIAAVRSGAPISSFVRSAEDQRAAVTGGYLARIGDTLMLVGGHRFDGRYNPMGGNSFTQRYHERIFRFTIDTTATQPALPVITELEHHSDPEHLHRRDYNLVPQVLPDGRHGYTVFSGVFQRDVDLPFLHPVDVTTTSYTPRPEFSQYLNHYHCASVPVVDSSATPHQQHTFFFGGMSQYTVANDGSLLQDDNVPFVRTIARISRDNSGTFREAKIDDLMPDLEGSSAEFVHRHDVPLTDHGVILGHRLPEDQLTAGYHIGYIVGGIRSTAPNIFFQNTGTQSSASASVYKVLVRRSSVTSASEIPVHGTHQASLLRAQIEDTVVSIDLELLAEADVYLRLYDLQGRLLEAFVGEMEPAGTRTFRLPLRKHRGPVLVAVQAHGRVMTVLTQ